MDGNPRMLILNRFKPIMSLTPEQQDEMGDSPFETHDWKWTPNLPTVSPFIDRIKDVGAILGSINLGINIFYPSR
jgi:hypothetical protein